jgi:hypothetical protein
MSIDLDTFIDARRHAGFAYFEHDCATIAADWVRERRGSDPLASLRAHGGALAPRRLLTALRYVQAAGGFQAAATALLGSPLPGRMAQRGDVVLVRSGRRVGRVSGYSLGICTGSHVVAPGLERLAFLPISEGVVAWRI